MTFEKLIPHLFAASAIAAAPGSCYLAIPVISSSAPDAVWNERGGAVIR